MARISLWMLSLSFLLPCACFGSRCLSNEAFNNRSEKLERYYEDRLGVLTTPPPQTCAQAAREMKGELRNRALSPWTLRLDTDPDRIPSVIAVAHCLCRGCIVDGQQDESYNSVPIYTSLLVFRKKSCRNGRYRLKKEFFSVSVGCTCVKPNSI